MRIAIKRTDGGVSIMQIIEQPTEVDVDVPFDVYDHESGITITTTKKEKQMQQVLPDVDGEIQKWKNIHTNQKTGECEYVSHVEISEDDIPNDRYFRNAWTHDEESGVVVDMDKARDIQMDKIRAARNDALSILDIETLKGVDVQAEKQVLRDIPDTFADTLAAAATPEELKETWPEQLEKKD